MRWPTCCPTRGQRAGPRPFSPQWSLLRLFPQCWRYLHGARSIAPLRKRHQQVLAQEAQLRWALHRANKDDALQQRRQWGLAVLQAGLTSSAPDSTEQTHCLRWLATLAADITAATPTPATAAKQALAVVRLLALDFEAATLTQLLPAG